jgi:sortase B
MDAGTMFGELDRYMDPDYARQHSLIYIGTPTEDRVYRVFSAFQTKIFAPEDNVFKYYEQIGSLDEPTYRETVAQIRALSMYDMADMPQYPAKLLFLSTCSYHTKEGRFVVAAYRTDADE